MGGVSSRAAVGGKASGSIFAAEHRRVTVGIVALILLVAFEAMAVATAMPVAADDLQGLDLYPWAFSGFLLASLFATVAAGELTDRYGPTRPLLGAVALFTGGLVVAGLAPDMGVFIVGRLVQGLGGGGAIVGVYVVVARVYPESLRPRVFAAMSGAWVLPSIVGPLAAGLIAEHLTWRLVFLGIAPLALAPVLLTLPALRHLEEEPGTGGSRLRTPLALGIAVGAAALQYAGQHPGLGAVAPAAVGVVLLVVALPRVLPAGAVRLARGLPTVVVMRGVLAGAFFGTETFVPLMLVEHRGLSPTMAGVSLTGGALGWATGSWWQGRPAMRTPRDRVIVAAAALITVGLLLVTATVFVAVPVWLVAVGWTVAGAGMGAAFSSIAVLLFELSPRAEQGANSAAVQLSDGLGSVTAIGIAGVAYAALRPAASGVVLFGSIFVLMVLVALAGVAVAGRVRPAEDGAG
jgi:MFS family permease